MDKNTICPSSAAGRREIAGKMRARGGRACSSFVAAMLFVLACVLIPAPVARAVDLADLAPDETLVYLQARNLTELREAWAKTPYYQMWTDSKFDLFFKPLKKKVENNRSDLAKNYGTSLDELKRIFLGEIAGFLSELRYSYTESTQSLYKEINSGMIARVAGDHERVRRLVEGQVLKDIPANASRSSEVFRGVTIYTTVYKQTVSVPIPDRSGGKGSAAKPSESELSLPQASAEAGMEYHYEYAFVDDMFILLEGQRAFMKKILSNYFAAKEGRKGAGAMSATPVFRSATRPLGEKQDVLFYANVERLLNQLKKNPSFAFIDRAKSLRLEELKSAALGVHLTPAAMEIDFAISSSPSPQGIAGLLIHGRANEFHTKKMVPRGAYRYSSSMLDVTDAYNLIRDTSSDLNGDGGKLFDGIVSQISQGAGINVGDLVSQIGGEVAVFCCPAGQTMAAEASGKEASEVFLVELKQETGVAENLAKLLSSFLRRGMPGQPPAEAKVDTTDFKGFPVYTVTGPPFPGMRPQGQNSPAMERRVPHISFAVAKSFLILSEESEPVKEVLRHATGEATDNLTKNEEFRRATADLKRGYASLSWTDMRKWTEEIARTFQTQPALMFMIGTLVQTTQMPAPEAFARYFGQATTAGYVTKDTYYSHGAITYPEGMVKK